MLPGHSSQVQAKTCHAGCAPCSKLGRKRLCPLQRCRLCLSFGSYQVFRSHLAIYTHLARETYHSFLYNREVMNLVRMHESDEVNSCNLLLTRFGVRGPIPNDGPLSDRVDLRLYAT